MEWKCPAKDRSCYILVVPYPMRDLHWGALQTKTHAQQVWPKLINRGKGDAKERGGETLKNW